MSILVKEIRNAMQEDAYDEAMGFRRPMQVREIMVFRAGWTFPICPRCEITLEREYMAYCDRCGQCLDWRKIKKAVIVYPKTREYH